MKINGLFALLTIVILLVIPTYTKQCPFGQFKTNETCVECPLTCAKCTRMELSCKSCPYNFRYNSFKESCENCNRGQLICDQQKQKVCQKFYYLKLNYCEPTCLVQNCNKCQNITSKSCLQCKQGRFIQNSCKVQKLSSSPRNLQQARNDNSVKPATVLNDAKIRDIENLIQARNITSQKQLEKVVSQSDLKLLKQTADSQSKLNDVFSRYGLRIDPINLRNSSSFSSSTTTSSSSSVNNLVSGLGINNGLFGGNGGSTGTSGLFGGNGGSTGSGGSTGTSGLFGGNGGSTGTSGISSTTNSQTFSSGTINNINNFLDAATNNNIPPSYTLNGKTYNTTLSLLQILNLNGVSTLLSDDTGQLFYQANGVRYIPLGFQIVNLRSQSTSGSGSTIGTTGTTGTGTGIGTGSGSGSGSSGTTTIINPTTTGNTGTSGNFGGLSGTTTSGTSSTTSTTTGGTTIGGTTTTSGTTGGPSATTSTTTGGTTIGGTTIGGITTGGTAGISPTTGGTSTTTSTTTGGTTGITTSVITSQITDITPTIPISNPTINVTQQNITNIINPGTTTITSTNITTTTTSINITNAVINTTVPSNVVTPVVNPIVTPPIVNPIVTPIVNPNVIPLPVIPSVPVAPSTNTSTTTTTNTSTSSSTSTTTATTTTNASTTGITTTITQIPRLGQNCNMSYYWNDEIQQCERCSQRCLNCKDFPEQCLQCNDGYERYGWKCVTKQHLTLNTTLSVPANQQQFALGVGINEYKQQVIKMLPPSYKGVLSAVSIGDFVFDKTNNQLKLNTIIDKLNGVSMTTLNQTLATNLKKVTKIGNYSLLNSTVDTGANLTVIMPTVAQVIPPANPTPTPENPNGLSPGILAGIIVPSVVGGLLLLSLLSCLLCYCCKCCCFKNKMVGENVVEGTDRRLIRNEINSAGTPVIARNEQINRFTPTHSINPAVVGANIPSVPSTSFVPTVPTVPVITPIIPIIPQTVSPKTNKINTQTSLGAVDSTNQVITGRFNQIDSNTNNTNTNLSLGAVDNKIVQTNTKIESQQNNQLYNRNVIGNTGNNNGNSRVNSNINTNLNNNLGTSTYSNYNQVSNTQDINMNKNKNNTSHISNLHNVHNIHNINNVHNIEDNVNTITTTINNRTNKIVTDIQETRDIYRPLSKNIISTQTTIIPGANVTNSYQILNPNKNQGVISTTNLQRTNRNDIYNTNTNTNVIRNVVNTSNNIANGQINRQNLGNGYFQSGYYYLDGKRYNTINADHIAHSGSSNINANTRNSVLYNTITNRNEVNYQSPTRTTLENRIIDHRSYSPSSYDSNGKIGRIVKHSFKNGNLVSQQIQSGTQFVPTKSHMVYAASNVPSPRDEDLKKYLIKQLSNKAEFYEGSYTKANPY